MSGTSMASPRKFESYPNAYHTFASKDVHSIFRPHCVISFRCCWHGCSHSIPKSTAYSSTGSRCYCE
jgi:hypothetical protein